MQGLSSSVVIEFCKLCSWAYETWLNHLELFDRNPRATELRQSLAGDTFARLSIISQEYALLQVVKLHDRAVVSGYATLGIDYIIEFGDWSEPVRSHLESLAMKLDEFASQLRDARNKSLSHNDLANMMAGASLGAFGDGEDEEYFKVLQEFVNIAHDEKIGGPWPFNDLVKNDVVTFLAMIRSS